MFYTFTYKRCTNIGICYENQLLAFFTADMLLLYVTLSLLRLKEITGIHKPCMPHSNDTRRATECNTTSRPKNHEVFDCPPYSYSF